MSVILDSAPRESYAQDLASLIAIHRVELVTGLTHQTTAAFLASQEHLAASTFNRRYAARRKRRALVPANSPEAIARHVAEHDPARRQR